MRDFNPEDFVVPRTQPHPLMTIIEVDLAKQRALTHHYLTSEKRQVKEWWPLANLRHVDSPPTQDGSGSPFEVVEIWPTEPRTMY